MVFLRSIAWIFAIRCNILKLQHYHSTFENQKYVHVFLLSLSVRVAKWVGFDGPGCLIRILAGWVGVFQSATHFGLSTQRAGRLRAGQPTRQPTKKGVSLLSPTRQPTNPLLNRLGVFFGSLSSASRLGQANPFFCGPRRVDSFLSWCIKNK